jgi:hypothetical protein
LARAIHSLGGSIAFGIAQGVDAIAFLPVVETGFEPVLPEAKKAGIPGQSPTSRWGRCELGYATSFTAKG